MDPEVLGACYAFDILIHECIHVYVNYVKEYEVKSSGTSHNNPVWVGEVNRLAPLIGINDVKLGGTKSKRLPIEGEVTKTGKPATKNTRVLEGEVPYSCVYSFPYELRRHFGQTDFYRENRLPFDLDLNGQELQ